MTFVTWDGAGNQPPAFGAAEELRDRGHDVMFAGYETQRERIAARGFAFALLARASAELTREPPPRPRPALMMASEQQLADVSELLVEDPPDVVVVDCLLFGALAAVEVSNVPSLVFVHSPPSVVLPPGGLLDTFLGPEVAQLRADASLRPLETLQQAWQGMEAVAVTIPEMDERPSPNVRYVGPIVPRTAHGIWASPWQPSDDRPLVVVSFTTGGWDQRSRIERTLHGLADASVRVLVTTAWADVDGLDVPANAVLAKFVPHAAVMPTASAVVTHGGHGTVMAAFAHGIPVACLPNALSDQPAMAERVVQLGAGISLDGEGASAGQIREAVDQLLRDPSFGASALELAASIKASPGAAGMADVVEYVGPNVP